MHYYYEGWIVLIFFLNDCFFMKHKTIVIIKFVVSLTMVRSKPSLFLKTLKNETKNNPFSIVFSPTYCLV